MTQTQVCSDPDSGNRRLKHPGDYFSIDSSHRSNLHLNWKQMSPYSTSSSILINQKEFRQISVTHLCLEEFLLANVKTLLVSIFPVHQWLLGSIFLFLNEGSLYYFLPFSDTATCHSRKYFGLCLAPLNLKEKHITVIVESSTFQKSRTVDLRKCLDNLWIILFMK